MKEEPGLGAIYLGEGRCRFRVWAPFAERVEVCVVLPEGRMVPLKSVGGGYHQGIVEDVPPGCLYKYRLNGQKERPDPASRFQPQGVHGPSQVVDSHFLWNDEDWQGLLLQEYVIYELHVGLFSPEGTFEGVIARLDELNKLGITAIELLPIAQFPGTRNWGYDGVYPFAVQNSYGGPEWLKRLVNACHKKGLAVILDVVYNHLGPEGNYFADYGPYFSDRHRTLWGPAVDFDGVYSEEIRRFFMGNALYWIGEFHIDALRLDAVHAIKDISSHPFVEGLSLAVHKEARKIKRNVFLIAESVMNDTRVVSPREQGGWGLDAQWNDDFHHALHALLTGEQNGYYADFGSLDHLVKAFREGFVYSGDYSAYRGRRHGTSSRHVPAQRFVIYAQNHDQVGNRILGERLTRLVSYEALKLAAAAVLLSPYVPLLFMGEEWGEDSPFFYFVDHSDPALVEAVRRGRREEFMAFKWRGDFPDPQNFETFARCRLRWNGRKKYASRTLLGFYRRLIHLRKETPALSQLNKKDIAVSKLEEQLLVIRRWHEESHICLLMNFNPREIVCRVDLGPGRWRKLIDSSEKKWMGPGSLMPGWLQSERHITMKSQSLSVYRSGA